MITDRVHGLASQSDFFNGFGRIVAFKVDIPTDFDMQDLDDHIPDSRTSTIWRLAFKLAGCPTCLKLRSDYFGLERQ